MKNKESILTLIAEIEEELKNIESLEKAISQQKNRIESATSPEKNYLIESAALKMHNFYNACERIFKKIAGDINGEIPATYDWHYRLLKNMTLDIPDLRPPVLTVSLENKLLEYLRFRHIVRNIYGFELDWERLKPLIYNFSNIVSQFKKEIGTFLEFLKTLAKQI